MFSERWLIYSKHICEGHECSRGQNAATPSDTPIRGGRVRQVFHLSVHVYHLLTTHMQMGRENGELRRALGRITVCCEEKPAQRIKAPNVSLSRFCIKLMSVQYAEI